MENYRYLTVVAMLFGSLLLFSNIVAEKLVIFGWFVLPASIVTYPLLYIMGSIITEVYGRDHATRITYAATALNILMVIIFAVVIEMPSAPVFHDQKALVEVLGVTGRIVVASIISFWVGEMVNILLTNYLKTHEKISMKMRALVANLTGLSVDCVIFSVIAFYHLSIKEIFIVAGSYYFFKVIYQLILISFMQYPVRYLSFLEGGQAEKA